MTFCLQTMTRDQPPLPATIDGQATIIIVVLVITKLVL